MFSELIQLTFDKIMQTRAYYWFAFTYRFPWSGSGQGRIAREAK